MAKRNIIVIGASAGGVRALQDLMRALPHDLPAAVFVVVHISPSSPGVLPAILTRAGSMKAFAAKDRAAFKSGHIYVAPPDSHLLIGKKTVRVVRGPRENGFRPAVDPLFRTAANTHGARVIGIVLSGSLDDGTLGLTVIKQCGGIAMVQDPSEAVFQGMPLSAIQNVEVDHVLPVAGMAVVLDRLTREDLPTGADAMSKCEPTMGPDVAEIGSDALVSGALDETGTPSRYTCPECGGALWEMKGGKLLRFRCHVGHGYTAEALVADQTAGLEAALWTALRALEEHASLRRRMAQRAKHGVMPKLSEDYEHQAAEAESRAGLIRSVLVSEPEQRASTRGQALENRAKQAKERPVPSAKSRPSKSKKTSSGARTHASNASKNGSATNGGVVRAHGAQATNRRVAPRVN